MTKIILVRHGHVEGINPKRFRGRSDVPLTELGLAQAKTLASRIARSWTPQAIYSSPMSRCVATANAIAESCFVTRHILDDLNDLDYGLWQWLTCDDVEHRWPTEYTAWLSTPHLVRFPNGESLQDLLVRSANALQIVMTRHRSGTVVLVGHESVNRALLLHLLDQPLSSYWRLAQLPCALNEIDIDDHIVVQRMNDTSHLDRRASRTIS